MKARITSVNMTDKALAVICDGLEMLAMIETTLEDEVRADYALLLRHRILESQQSASEVEG